MSLSYVRQPGYDRPPFTHPMAALTAAAASSPDKTALGYLGRGFTYAQLAGLTAAAAESFTSAGLQQGDRMIIQLQNVPQFIIALLGAWSRGIIVVPVSPMYRAREVRKLAADSGAVAILTCPSLWSAQGTEVAEESTIRTVFLTAMEDFAGEVPARLNNSREAIKDLPDIAGVCSVDFTTQLWNRFESGGPLHELSDLAGDDPALLAYTSGTTGPPKGAIVTHRNLMEAGWAYASFNKVLSPGEIQFCIAPLVHITGIGVSMMSWLLSASTIIIGYRFHPEQALEEIEAWSASWTVGTTTAFIALLTKAETSTHTTSSLRHATSGGAAVPAAVLERFRKHFGFDLLPGFGMTETSGSAASTPLHLGPKTDPDTGMASVGVALPGNELAVMDPDGRIVERGQRGELCMRGPAIVNGYWRQEDATAKTFRDGWLHTGDIGFMDDDGWFYVVDRIKNMIIASGYKVWPREVEEVIAHLEKVLEVAVVGAPDTYRGETVKAFVALREGVQMSEEDVIAHCRASLAAYKVPSQVVFMDELPKNPNGKVLHRALRPMPTEMMVG